MLHHPAAVRTAFHEAAEAFVDTVAAIDPAQLNAPGLGEWTVLELLAHTCRAFTTMESAVATACDTDQPTLASAADYYRSALASSPDLHAQVAERARADADGLGPDPIAAALERAQRALALSHRTPDEHPCATLAGSMRFGDYLPTRLVELVVHTRDLQRATGQVRPLPTRARAIVLELLVELVDRLDEPDSVIDLLTGRAGPGAPNVFA